MSKTVLLVEIEPAVRKLLRLRFELAGLTVLEAPTGERGLSLFRAYRASVVAIVSGELSEPLDGYGLLEALRKIDPYIPIFFFLSHSLPNDLFQAGVEVFMKPYGLGNLCRSVVAVAGDSGDELRPLVVAHSS
jgi:CheY-like chemotaxis protein